MPRMFDSFCSFHEANPNVYKVFLHYAFEMRAIRARYSGKAVFERMRWHMDIRTKGDAFKLNNNFTAFYARLAMLEFPDKLGGFFQIRELRSLSSRPPAEAELQALLETPDAPKPQKEEVSGSVPGTDEASASEHCEGSGLPSLPFLAPEEDIFGET